MVAVSLYLSFLHFVDELIVEEGLLLLSMKTSPTLPKSAQVTLSNCLAASILSCLYWSIN